MAETFSAYVVVERSTGRTIRPGATIVSRGGEVTTFVRVTRGPEQHYGIPRVQTGKHLHVNATLFDLRVECIDYPPVTP